MVSLAWRDLALRRMAAGVEEALTDYMHGHRIDEIWPAAERVLVLVDADPAAGAVLRNAWRLGSAMRAELVAAAVLPLGGMETLPAAERRALEKNLALAEDLGMRVRLIETADRAPAIAAAVREDHATLIVMRYARESGWRRLRGPSLVDELLDRLDNVDIHLVEGTRSGS